VEDIERARKSLSRQWHPDVNKSEDAARRFDEIQKAAEVLRDPIRRASYDRESATAVIFSLHDPQPPGHGGATPRQSAPWDPGDPGADGPRHAGSWQAGSWQAGSWQAGSWQAGSWQSKEPPQPRHRPEKAGGLRRPVPRWARRHLARPAAGRMTLVALVVIAGMIALLVAHPWQGAPATSGAGRRPAAGATAAGRPGNAAAGQSPGTFSLPAYTAGQAVLPAGSGRVLAIGQTITLLTASGQVLWHETASISLLAGGMPGPRRPQASGTCAVAGDGAGHRYDFISLATGQQAVVTAKAASGAGSFVLDGSRAALPDGTVRNACTGAVVTRAAPGRTLTSPECLSGSTAGSIVIGAGKKGQMAWRNGHELWRLKTRDQVICNPGSSVAMLATGAKFRFLNPLTGKAHWGVRAPACPGHCPGPAHPLLGTGGTLALTAADQVLGLARGDGKLLWRRSPGCALAVRSTPSPQVLVGPCAGTSGDVAGTATVLDLLSGAVIRTYPIGGDGCTAGGEWTANPHEVLVVCPGPAAGGTVGQASLTVW
jgi:curved DNA-binding protein CbpA